MEYLFREIADEFKNNDAILIDNYQALDNCSEYNLFVEINGYRRMITLHFNKFPIRYFIGSSEYYKIPLNLSLKKVIEIIHLIFINDNINKISSTDGINEYIIISSLGGYVNIFPADIDKSSIENLTIEDESLDSIVNKIKNSENFFSYYKIV